MMEFISENKNKSFRIGRFDLIKFKIFLALTKEKQIETQAKKENHNQNENPLQTIIRPKLLESHKNQIFDLCNERSNLKTFIANSWGGRMLIFQFFHADGLNDEYINLKYILYYGKLFVSFCNLFGYHEKTFSENFCALYSPMSCFKFTFRTFRNVSDIIKTFGFRGWILKPMVP